MHAHIGSHIQRDHHWCKTPGGMRMDCGSSPIKDLSVYREIWVPYCDDYYNIQVYVQVYIQNALFNFI